ncbi:MAG: histidine phosphatase family protein [Roseiflexaceae bacterium]
MSNTVITLIRHGESYANINQIVESYSCQGLTEKGIAQAHALATRIQNEGMQFDAYYASTLKRARMTAEILAPAIGLPIQWEDDLHELRVGEVDGMSYHEVSQRYPTFDRAIYDVHTKVAPGGESWNEFAVRCASVLNAIATANTGKHVAVVCHGGVIECSFLWALDLNAGVRRRVSFPARNTAMTVWHERMSSYDGRLEWQLVKHNDAMHVV